MKQFKVLDKEEADEQCCTPECGPTTCGSGTERTQATQAAPRLKRSKKNTAPDPCTCT